MEKEWAEANKMEMARLADAQQNLRVVEMRVPAVIDFLRSGASNRLATARESVRAAELALQQSEKDLSISRQELKEVRAVLGSQHATLEEIRRQVEAMELQHSLEEDILQRQAIRTSLQQLQQEKLHDVSSLVGENTLGLSSAQIRTVISQKIVELSNNRARKSASVEILKKQAGELLANLQKPEYRNAEDEYNKAFIRARANELTVKDIDKYYKALERAIQTYHKEKIGQINQVIACLWRQTYRGSDIDTIEIRSEADADVKSRRRSYSYGVVMRRGGREMDMRSRCSAGQKVLASVIIRLALSEAFCCDCGILALDEPTTNLDSDNARSLAESLRALIDARREVSNFQLVVITHDEEFVRILGAQRRDSYYYVHKDDEGAFSVITKRQFNN
jgi:DNA repair protein RAD50